ncbi:uncharacterized protein LOC121376032 [Gigantopelta aegis]|uniref:uncharacterized protein LOC121376032 n=1 Tax=Gigantopelta aegis TaxID=1735272 RepID=UPI001B88A953|nr:uncharacterized protein LOC121376032 [Gigantopelta aegis]
MLRLTLLAIILGVAATRLVEKTFKPQREYIYHYETQTISGMPGLSKIYSGLKIKAVARVQFHTASMVRMMFESVQVYKINEAVMVMDPTKQILPDSILTPVYDKELITPLTWPVTFEYVRGHVTNIKTLTDDPHWSVNIKRGLISIFVVNTKQKMATQPKIHSPFGATLFRAFETTSSGMCETEYIVHPVKEVPNAMKVIKVRNFHNCHSRPVWFKTMINAFKCAECVSEMNQPITESAQVTYSMLGTMTKFLITSAMVESQYSFMPYTPEKGRVTTFINQTMHLVDAKDIRHTVPIEDLPPTKATVRSIVSFIPEYVRDPTMPFGDQISPEVKRPMFGMINYTTEHVGTLLKVAAQILTKTVPVEATEYPIVIVNILRNVNASVIHEIWTKYGIPTTTETPLVTNMRKVLWTTMPIAGSFPVCQEILTTCVKELIPLTTCANFVNAMALTAEPSVHLFNTLIKIATGPTMTMNAQWKRAVFLSIGVLTHKMVEYYHVEMTKILKQVTVVEQIIQLGTEKSKKELHVMQTTIEETEAQLNTLYTQVARQIVEVARNQLAKVQPNEKLLALKMIGNAGLKETLPYVEEVIFNPQMPEIVRVNAIFALRRIATRYPILVREIVRPVVVDTMVKSSLRIAAFTMVMDTKPEIWVIESIAKHLHHEKDLQVASYIYTYMQSMANSTHPCYHLHTKNCSIAIQYAPKINPGFLYSTFHRIITNHNDYVKVFGFLDIATIGSPSTILPASLSTVFNMQALGVSTNIIEFGYHTEGLEAVVDKLIGPTGILTMKKSILDILRSPRSVSGKHKIEEIIKKLAVTIRHLPIPTGHAFIKLFGHELRYFTFDETMMDIINKAKITTKFDEQKWMVTQPVDVRNSMLLGDVHIIFPTEAGLPVTMALSIATTFRINGSLAFKVTPSIFETKRAGEAPIEAAATVSLTTSAAVEIRGSMHIDAFVTKVGTAFHMTTHVMTPVAANVTYNMMTHKLITEIAPPVQTEPLVAIEVVPYTFETVGMTTMKRKYIELVEEASLNEVVIDFGNTTLGMEVVGYVKVPSTVTTYPIPLAGRTSITVFMRPGVHVPPVIKIHAQFLSTVVAPSTQTPTTGTTATATSNVPTHAATSVNPTSNCDGWWSALTLCIVGSENAQTEQALQIAEQTAIPVPDYPDLTVTDVTIIQLMKKLQTKLGTSQKLINIGAKWGVVVVIDASTPVVPRKMQVELLWQTVNNRQLHQVVAHVQRTPIPSYDMQPWEMIVQSMVQFPSIVVKPEQVLDPFYQEQVVRNMQFMTKLKHHVPLLQMLNQTVKAILSKEMQNIAGNVEPAVMIKKLMLQVITSREDPFIESMFPLLTNMTPIIETIMPLWDLVWDPIELAKNEELLIYLVKSVEVIQAELIHKIKMFKESPPTTMYPSVLVLHYTIMEHYRALVVLTTIGNMTMNMEFIKKGTVIWQQTTQLLKEMDTVYLTFSDILYTVVNPTQSQTSDIVTIVQEATKLSSIQAAAIKSIVTDRTTARFPVLQPVTEMIEATQQSMFTIDAILLKSLITTIPVAPVIIQLALQQNMIYLQLVHTKNIIVVPQPIVFDYEKTVAELHSQSAVLTTRAAAMTKFMVEYWSVKDIFSPDEITLVEKIQQLQLTIGILDTKVLSLKQLVRLSTLEQQATEVVMQDINVILDKTVALLHTVVDITNDVLLPGTDPKIILYAKVTAAMVNMKYVMHELKSIILSSTVGTNTFTFLTVTRHINVLIINCTDIEYTVTRAFENFVLSANTLLVNPTHPMPQDLVMVTLHMVMTNQKDAQMEIESLKTSKPTALPHSIEMAIRHVMQRIMQFQQKIQMVEQLGVQSITPSTDLLAMVIAQQKGLIAAIKAVITSVQIHIPIVTPWTLMVKTLEQQLNEVVLSLSQVIDLPSTPPTDTMTQMTPEKQELVSLLNGALPMATTGYVNITFGTIGLTPKTVMAQIFYSKSIEQLLWEFTQISPFARSPEIDTYLTKYISGREVINMPSMPIVKLMNTLLHGHVMVKYTEAEIPTPVKTTFWKVIGMIPTYWRVNTEFATPVMTSTGTVHVLHHTRFSNMAFDVIVMTPTTTFKWKNMALPSTHYLPTALLKTLWMPLTATQPWFRRSMYNPYGHMVPATCEVSQQTVKTFDHVYYSLPTMGTCRAVLAMDCSPLKSFVVAVTPMTPDFMTKTLQIITADWIVDIIPSGSTFIVKINNAVQTVEPGKPVIIEKTLTYGIKSVALKIFVDRFLWVEMPLIGLQIMTNGDYIKTHVSTIFRSKTCGLCSNFDGQWVAEYEGPKGNVYTVPTPFVSSYLIPEPQCHHEKIHRKFANSYPTGHAKTCVISHTTLIKTLKKSKQICFSLVSVKECPATCNATTTAERKVDMYCVTMDTPEAKKIETEVTLGKTEILKGKPKSNTQKVTEPTKCVPIE